MIEESIAWHIPYLATPFLMTLIVWFFIGVLSLLAARRIKFLPEGAQGFLEVVFETVTELADSAIGKEAHRYYPLFLGVFTYILFGNLIGLVPGLSSPTATLSNTIGLALIVFIYYNVQGVRANGLGYLKHFLGPITKWYAFPLMILFIFIETIGQLARPVSLAIRLFGNIFAKEVLLGILGMLCVAFFEPGKMFLLPAPLILRPLIIALGTLVSLIQAGVFTILTIIYVAGATARHEGHEVSGEEHGPKAKAHA